MRLLVRLLVEGLVSGGGVFLRLELPVVASATPEEGTAKLSHRTGSRLRSWTNEANTEQP
jgi:hypothetical protein